MIDNYMFLRFISRDFTLREGSEFTLQHTVTRKLNTLAIYSVEHKRIYIFLFSLMKT